MLYFFSIALVLLLHWASCVCGWPSDILCRSLNDWLRECMVYNIFRVCSNKPIILYDNLMLIVNPNFRIPQFRHFGLLILSFDVNFVPAKTTWAFEFIPLSLCMWHWQGTTKVIHIRQPVKKTGTWPAANFWRNFIFHRVMDMWARQGTSKMRTWKHVTSNVQF